MPARCLPVLLASGLPGCKVPLLGANLLLPCFARCAAQAQKRFINDTIRSDFHRRFLERYIK